MSNNKTLCGAFGLYPNFVAGTLSKVQEIINFYVLSNNKLKYLDDICISSKHCTISSRRYDENNFKLLFGKETVDLTFETRIMDGNLPSELTFAYSIKN